MSDGSPPSGAITREQVEHLADLARLHLAADEVDAMVRDLGRMLGYVEALEELDTSDIEPTAHALPLRTPVRPDLPEPPMDPDRALANAPGRDGWAFVVPKVLASDEEG